LQLRSEDITKSLNHQLPPSSSHKHRIDFTRTAERVEEEEEEEEEEEAIVETASMTREEPQQQYWALCIIINMDRFRMLLLRLFVYCQLPHNLIEYSELRDLLVYIQPIIDRYLPGRTAVGDWVASEFGKGRETLKQVLSKAKLGIHLGFDMWGIPTGSPILGICAHFFNNMNELVHPLLALHYLVGNFTGLVMAEVTEAVMYEFGIVDRRGVCVADNADNNDTCVAALVRSLQPGEETTARRSRYFAHMVNLAAEAFIYGKRPSK
jgi:hypothetical protein